MLNDGDAQTACQTACPTDAIVFGNANDKNSAISKVRVDNNQRGFYVLEQLHVLPNVTYLAKVRNTDEIIETGHHAATDHAATEHDATSGEHKADSTLPSAPKTVEANH